VTTSTCPYDAMTLPSYAFPVPVSNDSPWTNTTTGSRVSSTSTASAIVTAVALAEKRATLHIMWQYCWSRLRQITYHTLQRKRSSCFTLVLNNILKTISGLCICVQCYNNGRFQEGHKVTSNSTRRSPESSHFYKA